MTGIEEKLNGGSAIMTIEEMKERKKELGLSYEQIAKLSGLPLGTVQKALGGITKSPRYGTIQALEKVFAKENPSSMQFSERYPEMVREPSTYRAHKEKKQGEYTIEDYFAIPDDRRVELIDGVIYDMAAPISIHQILVTQICMMFDRYIKEKKGDCLPIVSPIDVQLDCDDRTMVQPDVIVMCDRDKVKKHIYGHPDLVVEILSPSSTKLDNRIKLGKYANAGVREYWIVDPVKRSLLVYNFEEGDWPTIYGFDDKIPVHIFPEECEIDFSEIHEYIRFMYEQD